jgi:hypothetical protein
MFKSTERSILYTQYEHGRLAGTLARQWGNAAFDRPALDFEAFADGITLHDWGYGVLDNLPVAEGREEEWLQIIHRGVTFRHDSATTDIVTKLHMRRLLSWERSPDREALIAEIDRRVAERLPETGAPLEEFQRADKITQLCDMISFDFCFEAPRQRAFDVYPRQDSDEITAVGYEVRPGGEVRVDPWPFAVSDITGILYAFEREIYPGTLNPLIVPFYIHGS